MDVAVRAFAAEWGWSTFSTPSRPSLLSVFVIELARGGRPFWWAGGAPRKPASIARLAPLLVFVASLIAARFAVSPGN